MAEPDDVDPIIKVRRQWNDWRTASYRLSDVFGWHWDATSGGTGAPASQPFIHAYVWCNRILDGELAHPCSPGEAPHRIRVCITQKGNEGAWDLVVALAGSMPARAEATL